MLEKRGNNKKNRTSKHLFLVCEGSESAGCTEEERERQTEEEEAIDANKEKKTKGKGG